MHLIGIIKKIGRPFYGPVLKFIRSVRINSFIKNDVARVRREIMNCPNLKPKIFYLGITAHSNLGDMAQYCCIHNWLLSNYPEYLLIEVEADTVVNEKYRFIELLKKNYDSCDFIVFQSGYTTQDLGGVHDLMHRMVIDALPDSHILMMPQTVFFQCENNKQRSAKIYNRGHHMLFLARDKVSYIAAKEMMPDVQVRLFPDIVTSLIGRYNFNNVRKGISVCRRNDGEKYYSEMELNALIERLKLYTSVVVSDTTLKISFVELRRNPIKYIERQIRYFSQFEVVLTDRYHGTIFALAAGTPVVIIKTTDHKVITGADWFKGIYDDYVYVARDLEDAYNIISVVKNRELNHRLQPIFSSQYYEKLKTIFESVK
jgi:exopolysaccharide biosynthesis predicted pyruvyltransferase EpsI